MVSDNALIEGLEKAKLDPPPTHASASASRSTIIGEFYGKSEKGYAPYNPRKVGERRQTSSTRSICAYM